MSALEWIRAYFGLAARDLVLKIAGKPRGLQGRIWHATLDPHLLPLFDPRRGLVALGNRANIDQVIVDGRVLIDAGRYIHGDETAMMSAANAAIGKIWDLPEAQAAFNG